ncbi:hypothetical protein [Deinococcus sp. QL22]
MRDQVLIQTVQALRDHLRPLDGIVPVGRRGVCHGADTV